MTYAPEIDNCVIFFENQYGQRVALPVDIGSLLVRDDDQDDCSVRQRPAGDAGSAQVQAAGQRHEHHHHYGAHGTDFIAAAHEAGRGAGSVTGALVSVLPAVIVAIVTFGIVVLGQWSVPSAITVPRIAVAAEPVTVAPAPTPPATTTNTDRRAQK